MGLTSSSARRGRGQHAERENAGDSITLFEFGTRRLRSLCKAIGFHAEEELEELFRRMTTPWGERRIGEPPQWPSTVGDDDTPFEFSIGLDTSPEVRVLVEPLGEAPSLQSNADAGLALLESLHSAFDADLTRFERVRDLFLPAHPKGSFVMWVAAGLSTSGARNFKVYLNPFVAGEHFAPALVEEALGRLGLGAAWTAITTGLARRGPDLDQLMYFSLDLARSSEARIKVYARHRRCTVDDLEAAAGHVQPAARGDVTRFIDTVAPDLGTTFDSRAPLTCYAFSEGSGGPRSVTTHFPINGYAPHDGVVRERVCSYLEQVGLPVDTYNRALAAFANRPVDRGIGLQSYVSFRRERGKPRLTVYFPVEAYRPGQVASRPITSAPREASGILARFERIASVADQPFARRLRREPPNARALAVLWANHALFAGAPFELRRSEIAARLEGDPVRRLLKQRAAEAAERPQDSLFSTLLAEVKTLRPSTPPMDDAVLDPGRELGARLDELCGADNAWRAMGALAAGAFLEERLAAWIDDELRRHGRPQDAPALGVLAVRRAASEERVARFREVLEVLPDASVEATWRGGADFARAAWRFFGQLYASCFA